MRIDNEIEYRAAKDVFRRYKYLPNRSKNHPLQESMEVLANAVNNYEIARDLVSNTSDRKAA